MAGMRTRDLLFVALLGILPGCTTFDDAVVRESASGAAVGRPEADPSAVGEEQTGSPEATRPDSSGDRKAAGAESHPQSDGAAAPPAARFTHVPAPEGCIDDVSAGDHVYSCDGLRVDVTIPPLASTCPAEGCGIIVELHGDTGTGPLIDAHLRLRARAAPRGYIVVAPTGPAIGTINRTTFAGSSWSPKEDEKVVAITKLFAQVFKADPKRIHVTGFSRGGFMTWRLACDHSTLFASVAPGAAGNANTFLTVNQIEPTCFTAGRFPSRPIPILTLIGKTDVPVPYASMIAIKDAALTRYGIPAAALSLVEDDGAFVHVKSTKEGAPTVEWFDHTYETSPTGAAASAKGHCVPGSTYDPNAAQYAYACNPTPASGFDWGAEVLAFFERTPLP